MRSAIIIVVGRGTFRGISLDNRVENWLATGICDDPLVGMSIETLMGQISETLEGEEGSEEGMLPSGDRRHAEFSQDDSYPDPMESATQPPDLTEPDAAAETEVPSVTEQVEA